MGSDCLSPSQQTGNAHSPLPAAPSKSAVEEAMAGLIRMQKTHTEYEDAIQAAIEVITDQQLTIEFLGKSLASVRDQLQVLTVGLDMGPEELELLETMQGTLILFNILSSLTTETQSTSCGLLFRVVSLIMKGKIM
jgi:hypothetical protein